MERTLWDDDEVQFARLIDELMGTELPSEVFSDLCASMDLEMDELESLIERANSRWEDFKRGLHMNGNTPNSLVRHHEHGEDYEMVGEGAWIGVPAPSGQRGFDIRILRSPDGVHVTVFREFTDDDEDDLFDTELEEFVPWAHRSSPSV